MSATDEPEPARIAIRRRLWRKRWLLPLAAGVALGAWWSLHEPPATAAPVAAGWVDESTCRTCHAAQFEAWRDSDHHRALQPASEASVLGDFADRSLETDAESSRFFRRDDTFWIRTPGPDGRPADYRVAYTLGVDPLQQYLLWMPDGRLQAHGAAWDVSGGRWFHLYDGEGVDYRHRLHWTGAQQNADFMCLECHTTGYRRGYDPVDHTWESRWHAPGVGCQSCHGPAADHLRWAKGSAPDDDGTKGFAHGVAHSGDPRELAICARCHSRRTPLGNGFIPGEHLLDAYLPEILTADLYEVDGTIDGEVFEYGSFRQSRMHAAGVLCSDCHDPHTAGLRAPDNALCTRCHSEAAAPIRGGIDGSGLRPKAYDDPSHHHHAAGSAGARCVACHMPGKLYMGNDLRHDHSFSSPHPIEARALSHSDACLDCHSDDEADEVVTAFQRWYPGATSRDGGYARALHAARHGSAGAAAALLDQLERADLPDIRRATLLTELPNYPSAAARRALVEALRDPSPLVRRTAADVLGPLLPPPERARLLGPLRDDPVRAVRIAASWQLLQAPAPPNAEEDDRRRLIAEYEEVQRTMLDRAESLFNLAGVYALTGRSSEVEPALREALRLDPSFHPALVHLAQWLERTQGDREAASRLLQDAIERDPQAPLLWHALGLMRVRQGERTAALEALRRAHELAPEHPDFGFALAAALHDRGDTRAALELLRMLSRLHPADRTLRQALIAHLQAAGLHEEAAAAWAALEAQNPNDPLLLQRGRQPPRP